MIDYWDDDFEDEFLQMFDNAKQLPSSSALHLKATEKDEDLPSIIKMIENGHNPLNKDENGNTVLHLAAIYGHLSIIKYFIDEHGFNPAVTGNRDYTLLHSATQGSHLHVVQYLLHEKMVDPVCFADKEITPLHIACYAGKSDIVEELLQSISQYLHAW